MRCKNPTCSNLIFYGDYCNSCASFNLKRNEAIFQSKIKPTSYKLVVGVLYMAADGQNAPNRAFKENCEGYKERIEYIYSQTSKANWGKKEKIKGWFVYHHTQKVNNKSVFFDWQGKVLRIFGVGKHTGGDGKGNDKYEIEWYTGKKIKYDRSK